MNEFEERLKDKASLLNIELNDTQLGRFYDFYISLIEKNKVMNLTSITEETDVINKHFIDSIVSRETILKATSVESIIDVGTGAGFPGIPLAIIFPEIKFTLADSLNKRLEFINDVCKDTGIENIRTIHGRAEDLARDISLREKFDVTVSRAVANLSTLSEYCLPFVNKKGVFIAYKTNNVDEEVDNSKKAIRILGGKVAEIKKFRLPMTDIERSLVVIRKEQSTPNLYPRKAGTPSKKPL